MKDNLKEELEELKKSYNENLIKQRKQFGITLVALVITIIVLLILAGITVAQLSGSGFFDNVKLAKDKYKSSQDLEESILSDYENASLNGIVSTRDGDTNPVGTIIAYMGGTTAPENYLACDGSEKNIADYPKLAAQFETGFGSKNKFGGDGTTTFAVPNLQGEFLRGYSTSSTASKTSGVTTEAVGNHQDATIIPHLGCEAGVQIRAYIETTTSSNNITNADKLIKKSSGQTFTYVNSTTTSDNANTAYKYLSRPTNTSVLYCIKAK